MIRFKLFKNTSNLFVVAENSPPGSQGPPPSPIDN